MFVKIIFVLYVSIKLSSIYYLIFLSMLISFHFVTAAGYPKFGNLGFFSFKIKKMG